MRFVAALIVLALNGCTYKVWFRSQPAGARVYVDGALVGVTPLEHDVPEGTSYVVRMELDGYEPATKQVRPEEVTVFVGGVPDPGPRPTYDVTDPGRSNVDVLGYEARRNQAFFAAATGNRSRRWPREVSLTLSPRLGTTSPGTPSPAPRPPAPATPPRTPPPARPSPPRPVSTSQTFCGACGARANGGGRYCGACGARLGAAR